MKLVIITPVSVKWDRKVADNYCHVSDLPILSKIFEIFSFLSKNQCKFRKRYSTQQCLLTMSKKLKAMYK